MTGVDRILSVASRYLTEIRAVQPTGPYRLGGWCFGGVVAFEIAQQLHEQGEEVEFLALLGISALRLPATRGSGGVAALPASARGRRAGTEQVARARGMRPGEAVRFILCKGPRVVPYLRDRLARGWPPSWVAGRASYPRRMTCPARTARRSPATPRGPSRPRVTLFLSREETATYTSDPLSDWRGLALPDRGARGTG